jgi:hypothetical protein
MPKNTQIVGDVIPEIDYSNRCKNVTSGITW